MMTRAQLSKFLWTRLGLTFLLSGFFTAIIALALFSASSGSLEGNQALTLAVLAGIGWSLILTVCSITVFFNLDAAIAHNRIYNFITWYFLPITAAASYAIFNITSDMWLDSLAMTVPFFAIQTFFYIQFNKRVAIAG